MPIHRQKQRFIFLMIFLGVLLFASAIFAVLFGEEYISYQVLWQADSPERSILLQSRLPRVLLGILVGTALSSGGVAFQSLLRNPLADPYILGVSGGAALGSVLALAFKLPFIGVSLVAFISALFSLLLIYWIAQDRGRLPIPTLLLTGVIFNAFCFSIIMFINTLLSFTDSHRIWYLMVGSLERENYSTIAIVALFVVLGFGWLWWDAAKMNLVATGDESAQYLGLDVHRYRKRIFFAASLMIGATVSVAGLIGLLGLFIPHLVRLMIGADHRLLLPASGLFGASFLVLADWLARNLLSGESFQTQFPVGVITALVGGPFFVYLLKRSPERRFW